MALQTSVPTAAVMLSDNNVDLSKPPGKWRTEVQLPKSLSRPSKGGGEMRQPPPMGGGAGGKRNPSVMGKANTKSQVCYTCGEAWDKEHRCSKKKNNGASGSVGHHSTPDGKSTPSTKKLSRPPSGDSDND
jgi:hypothetical protein